MNTHSVIVRITNDQTGQGEIQNYTESTLYDENRAATLNSRDLMGKPVGSLWDCVIRVTDKGSRKIDALGAHNKSAATIVESTLIISPEVSPEITTSIVSVQTAAQTEDTSIVPIVPIVPMILDADIELWNPTDYYVDQDARLQFMIAYRMLQRNPYQSVKLLLTGESGYGKTTIAQVFAKYIGFDCLRVNCATMRDTEEWFLDREVIVVERGDQIASRTIFSKSRMAQIMERGNCVIILDEFNRTESNIHNSLYPLLDDDGRTNMHNIDFVVGPNVIFVATMNFGYKFSGTFQLDDALSNRFEFVMEVGPMPALTEIALLESKYAISSESAESIVRLATIIRDGNLEVSCSTRDTLRIAKMHSHGLSLRDAFEFAVILRVPNDDTGQIVRKNLTECANTHLGTRE